ncbi:MAG TPA: hypothetical protein VL171_10715 [Verrucomicrobiae bacterium]|nr:hypothetical protein [Verrucomicrobiae bacterium]
MRSAFRGIGLLIFSLVGLSFSVRADGFTTNIISGISTNISGTVFVGDTGSFNYLEINSGGALSSDSGLVGHETSASNNTVLITGLNSRWQMTSFLGVGGPQTQITITNGACVASGVASLDNLSKDPSRGSSIKVSDNSTWENRGELVVGYGGAGNCLIAESGSILRSNTTITVGYLSRWASNNLIMVQGTGSRLSGSATITIGADGGGCSLVVSNGGRVDSVGAVIGNQSTSGSNEVVVTGSNSLWNNAGSLTIAGGGGNRFVISDGAQVTNNTAIIFSNNTVEITGPNSRWQINSLGVLDSGNQVTVTNQAHISSKSIFSDNGSPNANVASRILISDGSTWDNQGSLTVGYNGTGNCLTIEGGSILRSNTSISIGSDFNTWASSNSIVVQGNGSRLSDSGSFTVGQSSDGCSLVVSNSGYVNCGSLTVGNGDVTGNQVYISSTAIIDTKQLIIGNGAAASSNLVIVAGALNITNGGSGQVQHGGIILANGSVTAGFLNVLAGGFITGCGTISATIWNSGTIVIDCAGGTLTINGGVTNTAVIQAINGSDIEFLGPVDNTGTIDVINGSAHFLNTFRNKGAYSDAGTVLRSPTLSFGESAMTVSFGTVSGKIYSIEYNDDLASTNWMTLSTNVTATGEILSVADPSAASLTQRFYRVRLSLP